jgi:hypothetical protein
MNLLERRKPVAWSLMIAGALFGALAIYALSTGDAFVLGRRGQSSRHILRAVDPDRFFFYVRFFFSAATILWFVGLVRLVPIEDWIRKIRDQSHQKIAENGYDKKPAPWWGYLILVLFLALVIWVGKLTMYSE